MEILAKSMNVPSGNLLSNAKKQLFFVAYDHFFNTKVVIFKKFINLLYEIRSMPAGKISKNNKHANTFIQ